MKVKKHQIEAIQHALCNTVKVIKKDALFGGVAVRFEVEMRDMTNHRLHFYALCPADLDGEVILSDSGQVTRMLETTGLGVRHALVQNLVQSFGLTMTAEHLVIDMTRRPWSERIAAMLQVLAGADAILRSWLQESSTLAKTGEVCR